MATNGVRLAPGQVGDISGGQRETVLDVRDEILLRLIPPLRKFVGVQSAHGDCAAYDVGHLWACSLDPGAELAKRLAKLFNALGEMNPNPFSVNSDGLKCYTVSASRQPNAAPPNHFIVADQLFGVDPNVQANQFQYICAPPPFCLASDGSAAQGE